VDAARPRAVALAAIQRLLTTAIDNALNELTNTSFDDEVAVEGVV
jgi:hypothetical protein